MIYRTDYMQYLNRLKDTHIIKIVTGVRRCGKSTLLSMFADELLEHGIKENQIITVNLEKYENKILRNADNLHSHIKNRLTPGKRNYIFIDEVQLAKGFEEVIDSLFIDRNNDVYVTGSNADMLSGEIATILSGRYIEVKMLPLSFSEYVKGTGDDRELGRKYADYLTYSSFPYAMDLGKDDKVIRDYLNGIYSTIVLKDIVKRKKITDVTTLENIIRFLMDSIGSVISSNKISNTLTSNGKKTDVKKVEKYLRSLLEVYLFYEAKRYDVKGRKLLKTLGKYYTVDIGLRNLLLQNEAQNTGHILENVVYLELIRRHAEVYIGKVDRYEVDFVAVDEKGTTYYQVATTVRDEDVLSRELRSLKGIGDDNPKILLTLDDDPPGDYSGIKKYNALSWFMNVAV